MSLEGWRILTISMAAVGQTLFVLLYMTFPWYKTFLGRALFIKAATFMMLVDVAVLGRIFDWDHEDIWIVVLYGTTAFGVWAQLVAFLCQRIAHRNDDREYYRGVRSD